MKLDPRVTSSLRTSRIGFAGKHLLKTSDDFLAGVRRLVGIQRKPAVLFEVHNAIGFDAQEPVIEQLAERGMADVCVSGGAERGLAPHRITALGQLNIEVLPLAASRHRRFDAVVITDSRLVNSWRSSRYVYLHHGSGAGNRPDPYAFEILACGDANYLLALNTAELRDARVRFGQRLRGHVRVIGQPKLDRLVNTTHESGAWLESLGLDPMRKTILVLSHWTPTSLMHTCGEEVLRLLRSRTEFNILVTGHHHLWDHPARSGGVDWRAHLGWIADEPHMRLLPQPEDLIALMTAADFAITDHTSATAEYAILNRPIVLFRNPAFVFFDQEFDVFLRRTSTVFSQIHEFAPALAKTIESSHFDRASRRQLLEYSFCHLGESARMGALAIEDIAASGIVSEDTAAAIVGGLAR